MKKTKAVVMTALTLSVLMAVPSLAGEWICDPSKPSNSQGISNWWYQNMDGSYAKDCWMWLDGNGDGTSECYRFDSNGWMYAATQVDGYEVNESGAWIVNGKVQTKKETTWAEWSDEEDEDEEERDGYDTSYEKSTSDFDNYADECFRLINKERKKKGRKELEQDSELQEACDIRAEELAEQFSHTRPDGTSCVTALEEAGADYMTWGENIAAGQKTPEAAVNAWMNSTVHRNNILNKKFGRSAVGFYYAPGENYQYFWVQMFTD